MTPESLTELKQRLTEAEMKVLDRIIAQMPVDELEEKTLPVERDFRKVRKWLDTLAQ